MAEVFLARVEGPMGFAKKCVVKRILSHFNDDPRFVEMFLAEARLAAELNHPNLVQIFDFGQDAGQYFLAMEWIDGPNLRALNRSVRAQHGAMDFALAARIIHAAAEGLHFAHELRSEQGEFLNLVHRDVSPDNILVARTGAVKVVDFGIAKATSQPHLTRSGAVKGKVAYMAPEQLAREPLDRRADLFALGIVLYELVTGSMPFDATSEVSVIQAIMSATPLTSAHLLRPDCPPALQAIIARCLEKDRRDRYDSCTELQGDLEALIHALGATVGTREIAALVEANVPKESEPESLPTPSGSATVSDRPLPAAPPRRLGVWLGLAMLVVGAGALTTALVLRQPVVTPPVQIVDAGPIVVAIEDAGLETEVDAGPALAEEELDAGPPTTVTPQRTGKLSLRIRPYAVVSLDDRPLGETPLPSITVPLGRHKLRLVNESLGKDLVLDVVIKPGDNLVKYNLKE